MDKEGKQTKPHERQRQQYGDYQQQGDVAEQKRIKGVKYMVIEDDQTLGGGCTMECTDDALQNCTLEIEIILLTIAIPVNLIKNGAVTTSYLRPSYCLS